MPLYGALPALTDLRPGDPGFYLFNGETLTPPQASVAFARGQSPSGGDEGVTFTMDFASAPTSVLYIQGANIDSDAEYQTLWTSTSTQHDNYTDTARWSFYRAKLNSQSAGGTLTVVAKR